MWPTAVMRPQIMTLKHRVSIIMGGHGRRGPTRLSCGKQQAVACATAVATFGGATHAAKCEMRDLHSSASHHQVGELAEDAEPLAACNARASSRPEHMNRRLAPFLAGGAGSGGGAPLGPAPRRAAAAAAHGCSARSPCTWRGSRHRGRARRCGARRCGTRWRQRRSRWRAPTVARQTPGRRL